MMYKFKVSPLLHRHHKLHFHVVSLAFNIIAAASRVGTATFGKVSGWLMIFDKANPCYSAVLGLIIRLLKLPCTSSPPALHSTIRVRAKHIKHGSCNRIRCILSLVV